MYAQHRRCLIFTLLLAAMSAIPAAYAQDGKSAADLARAAEQAAARARYEQSEREIESMLRARKEQIRREIGGVRPARARTAGTDEAGAASRESAAASWSYEGENGPENWGRLRPEWAQCASGERQTPIDIRDGIAVELEPVVFDYQPSAFTVIDTGRTVQVDVAQGNRITLTGRSYELQQFHFHRPSEEKINGRGFAMVAHLVHKDAEGRLAVVAVLIENGSQHPLLQTVWNNLPLEKHEPVMPLAQMDVSQLLPAQREYYTYMGSMSVPPCSEGVLWIVFKQPVQASERQIGIFSRLYPMNARPVQRQSGRIIKESS